MFGWLLIALAIFWKINSFQKGCFHIHCQTAPKTHIWPDSQYITMHLSYWHRFLGGKECRLRRLPSSLHCSCKRKRLTSLQGKFQASLHVNHRFGTENKICRSHSIQHCICTVHYLTHFQLDRSQTESHAGHTSYMGCMQCHTHRIRHHKSRSSLRCYLRKGCILFRHRNTQSCKCR